MPSLEIIGGATFSLFASKALPTIPGLLAYGMFGSGSGSPGNDGINGNRVVGGAAFSNSGAAPIYANNYATVGTNGTEATAHATLSGGAVASLVVDTGGANYVETPLVQFSGGGGSGASATAVLTGGVITGFTSLVGGSGFTSPPTITFSFAPGSAINTNIIRTADMLASGWTWIVVARAPTSGSPSVLITDMTPGATGPDMSLTIQNSNISLGGVPILNVNFTGGTGDLITSTMASAATNFKCIAVSYAGGGAAAVKAYNLTDAIYPSLATSPILVSSTTRVMKIGYDGGLPMHGAADVASVIIASGVLNLTSLQAIYAALRVQEAQRGIVC